MLFVHAGKDFIDFIMIHTLDGELLGAFAAIHTPL